MHFMRELVMMTKSRILKYSSIQCDSTARKKEHNGLSILIRKLAEP